MCVKIGIKSGQMKFPTMLLQLAKSRGTRRIGRENVVCNSALMDTDVFGHTSGLLPDRSKRLLLRPHMLIAEICAVKEPEDCEGGLNTSL
jgi:hypothetical protein